MVRKLIGMPWIFGILLEWIFSEMKIRKLKYNSAELIGKNKLTDWEEK